MAQVAVVCSLLFVAFFFQVDGQVGCGEQLQRCGAAAEPYEQQIRALKAVAFRACVGQPACQSEMLAFDECFVRSLSAVRQATAQQGLSLTAIAGNLGGTAEHFRLAVDRCFALSSTQATFGGASGSLVDSDTAYSAAIYSADFADKLWGMQTSSASTVQDNCFLENSDVTQRLFGDGISRTVDSADPRYNNLNTSCYINEIEQQCYRIRIEGDPRFQQLLNSRNQAIRTCLQSIRLQTQCRSNNDAQLQLCLCNAREEFELRLQNDLLECVRQSPVSRRQTASLLGTQTQIFPPKFDGTSGTGTGTDRLSQPSNQQLTLGIIQNGQCMCACNQHDGQSDQSANSLRPQAQAAATVSQTAWPWYQNNQYPSDQSSSIDNGNQPAQYPDYARTFESYYWNNKARLSTIRDKPNDRGVEDTDGSEATATFTDVDKLI